MKCQCERCSDSPSPTFSEFHKLECEARYWLNKPLAQRREYLARPAVQPRRETLEAEIRHQWEIARSTATEKP